MKSSIQHLRSRFAEITFLGFLLVLATRASFATEVCLSENLPASQDVASIRPVDPLSPR